MRGKEREKEIQESKINKLNKEKTRPCCRDNYIDDERWMNRINIVKQIN